MLCHPTESDKRLLIMTCDIFSLACLPVPLIHLLKHLLNIQDSVHFFEYFDNLYTDRSLPLYLCSLNRHGLSHPSLCYLFFVFVLEFLPNGMPDVKALQGG